MQRRINREASGRELKLRNYHVQYRKGSRERRPEDWKGHSILVLVVVVKSHHD